MNRFANTLIAVSVLFAAPGIAQAKITETETGMTMGVKVSDLNLATPEGQAALQRRIAQAATIVCGGYSDDRTLQMKALYGKCYNKAKADAMVAAAAYLPTAMAAR